MLVVTALLFGHWNTTLPTPASAGWLNAHPSRTLRRCHHAEDVSTSLLKQQIYLWLLQLPLYFALATITTVGYGDFNGAEDANTTPAFKTRSVLSRPVVPGRGRPPNFGST